MSTKEKLSTFLLVFTYFLFGPNNVGHAGLLQRPLPPHQRPDPNLVPIIDELYQDNRFEEICQLLGGLRSLIEDDEAVAEDDQEDEQGKKMLQDTLTYAEQLLNQSKTNFTCASTTPPSREETTKDAPVAETEEDYSYDNDGDNFQENVPEERLCSNCDMDYDEEETKTFLANFGKKDGVVGRADKTDVPTKGQGADAMATARNRLVAVLVATALGFVVLTSAATLACFFCARACVRYWRRRRNTGDIGKRELACFANASAIVDGSSATGEHDGGGGGGDVNGLFYTAL